MAHTSFKNRTRQGLSKAPGSIEVARGIVLIALEWTIQLCPFVFGLFFPWASAVVSLILTALLCLLVRSGTLHLTRSIPFLTAAAIVVFHLGGIIWGVDRGMAPVGAVQFLPLPLFVLLLEQFALEQRMCLLRRTPYVASAMVVLSFVLGIIVPVDGWFFVAGRQAGFFQYPNTYAVYLLFAAVLVLFGSPLLFGRIPWLAILMLGIVLSGSRTAFVLLLAVLLVFLFREKASGDRLCVLVLGFLVLLGSVFYVLLSGERSGIGRFLTISLSSSEFLGRLLYAQDALPVILKHPLGLGYTGYRWLQGSFQTGVYSVQHVHNELLQLLLDVGWIPTGLFLWALWKSLCSPVGGFCRKMLLAVLLLHSLLDFDTQFVSIALFRFLVMNTEVKATKPIRKPLIAVLPLILSSVLSIWIGTSSILHYLGNSSVALRIDPVYTDALVSLLSDSSAAETDLLADRILALNSSVSFAYDAKAQNAFSAGDVVAFVSRKQEAIRLSRYQLQEYLDYFDMLRITYERLLKRNDLAGAARCLEEIRQIPGMLEEVKAQTSPLGWRIRDLPSLELPPDYLTWLNVHRTAA